MIKQFFTVFFMLFTANLMAQKWSGQWSGSFDAKGEGSQRTEYVLEIDANGKSVSGTSVTYFTIMGKRYYTICEITGTIDPQSKTITSTETKVIKRNTPPDFRDCLQTHILTYFKKGETEELAGIWKSAKADGGCGTGTTVLSRKQLIKNTVTTPPPANTTVRNNTNNKTAPPTAKKPSTPSNENKTTTKPPVVKPTPKKDSVTTNKPSITKVDNEVATDKKPDTKPVIAAPKMPNGLERRDNKVFETISIVEDDITITLFDNAEIDGDIITVLFNGEVVVSQKQLSDQPITLKLKAIRGRDNTLTMYAENQGKIPPNTAIMRVQSGDNYYKVFLSADDKKNASVIFRLK